MNTKTIKAKIDKIAIEDDDIKMLVQHRQKTDYHWYCNKDRIHHTKEEKRRYYYTLDKFKKELQQLKDKMTPEGWVIVKTFLLSSAGINRWWFVDDLNRYVESKEPVAKSNLRSYSNTDLWKLFETGDLIQK